LMIENICGSTGHIRLDELAWQLEGTRISKCSRCGTHLVRLNDGRWVTPAELQPEQRQRLLRAAWSARCAARQPDVSTVRLDDLLSQNQLSLERTLQQMLAEHPPQSRQPRLLTVVKPAHELSREWPVEPKEALVLAHARTAKLAPSEASERQIPFVSRTTPDTDGRQMSTEICSEAERQLLNLHRKLHLAMDRLINRNDYKAAEGALREVDQELVILLNTAKVR